MGAHEHMQKRNLKKMYELLRHRLPAENMLNCAQEEKVEPIQFV
jgi:hypothetical protein